MVNYFFSKFVKCNQDKLFIAHPKNEDQLKILEAIGKALKIKYKTSDTEFNPEFLVKLKRSQKQFEQGKFKTIKKGEIKSLLGL